MTNILIVGGGMGGCAAAWALSRTPALRAQFSVRLVTPGWRLGGKGASGRRADGRIVEHGLHMFMGWYEHAFYLLREVYAARASAAGSVYPEAMEAFEALRELRFGRPGTEDFWDLSFPQRAGVPGDALAMPPAELRSLAVGLVRGLFRRLELPLNVPDVGILALETLVAGAGEKVALLALPPDRAYRAKVLVELVSATLRAIVAEDVETKGLAVLNDRDLRLVLRQHGASEVAVNSGLLKALYDLAFAYNGGSETNPSVEAGTMLRTALRMGLEYADAPVFRMRGGMGDIVFAPLYEVLTARGVKVDFFRWASDLTLTPDQTRVQTLTLGRQAALAGPTYDPLVNYTLGGKTLACWPEEPLAAQLTAPVADPRAMERGLSPLVGSDVLTWGTDFDHVVLAVPLGGPLGATLAAARPAWTQMRSAVRTVATRSAQLWLNRTPQAMGWPGAPSVHSGFVPPWSSWADMAHLLPVENESPSPAGLIYLCGVATDPGDLGAVNDSVSDWLDAHGDVIFPQNMEPAGFRYSALSPTNLAQHVVRINDTGWERYTLTVPNSSRRRIVPGQTGFANLSVAGDWVQGRINGGCAEAATEAGFDAADAIILQVTGQPRPPYPAL